MHTDPPPAAVPSTAALRLSVEYRRARAIWSPFHTLWATLDGRLHLDQPDETATEVGLLGDRLTPAEAMHILELLAADAAFLAANAEIRRRSEVMAASGLRLGRSA